MGKPYRPKDPFYHKAKKEGLRARSAFKLEEMAQRFSLLKKGFTVVDLGAAPGGFLQIIAEAVGPTGRAVGVDLAVIRPFTQSYVTTAVLDVLDEKFPEKLALLHPGPYDTVISDLAPKTSGIRNTDEARSLRLAGVALDLALSRGRPGGAFLAKLFMGGDFESFRARVREHFQQVQIVRPEATRGGSMEVYVVGLQRKASPGI